jgi:hypothetical protein
MSRPIEVDDTRRAQLRQIVAEFLEFRIGQRCVWIPMVGHLNESSTFAFYSSLLRSQSLC